MVRAHPNRSKNVRKYALSLLGKKAEPPLSPQGIGEGEGYTIVPSRSMQVLHTPRGYGGRLPHPVRGGGAYRDSPPHPLPVARLPGGGGVGYPPVAGYYPPG